MPVTRRKQTFAADELVVCIESFASSIPELPACSRGAKLRGDNPYVKRWPQYFLLATADDVEIARARAAIYEAAGASPPTS
jgi:hypothetical protein